jgi:hypothetical protein
MDEFLKNDLGDLEHDGGSDSDQLWDSPLETETRPALENPQTCELEARFPAALDTCRPDPKWACAEGEVLLALASDVIAVCPTHFVLSDGQHCFCVTTSDASTSPSAVPRVC